MERCCTGHGFQANRGSGSPEDALRNSGGEREGPSRGQFRKEICARLELKAPSAGGTSAGGCYPGAEARKLRPPDRQEPAGVTFAVGLVPDGVPPLKGGSAQAAARAWGTPGLGLPARFVASVDARKVDM